MTREVAIQLLGEKIGYLQSFINCAADPEKSYPDSIKFCEALDMAISALREQEEYEIQRQLKHFDIKEPRPTYKEDA